MAHDTHPAEKPKKPTPQERMIAIARSPAVLAALEANAPDPQNASKDVPAIVSDYFTGHEATFLAYADAMEKLEEARHKGGAKPTPEQAKVIGHAAQHAAQTLQAAEHVMDQAGALPAEKTLLAEIGKAHAPAAFEARRAERLAHAKAELDKDNNFGIGTATTGDLIVKIGKATDEKGKKAAVAELRHKVAEKFPKLSAADIDTLTGMMIDNAASKAVAIEKSNPVHGMADGIAEKIKPANLLNTGVELAGATSGLPPALTRAVTPNLKF